jgi:hypothetical protein
MHPIRRMKKGSNRTIDWIENWGLTLAFAVTQSVETAEQLAVEALVVRMASDVDPSSASAVQFAATLWELANKKAYRGFGPDTFFRMPAVARAILVLKLKARFSRKQVAAALQMKEAMVDDHLENARLLFSEGRPWIGKSPAVQLSSNPMEGLSAYSTHSDRESAGITLECPQWAQTELKTDLQNIFALYVGNDLDQASSQKLHAHLLVCNSCRGNFADFKKQYVDWAASLPMVDVDDEYKNYLQKTTRSAFRTNRTRAATLPPVPWPGMRRVMRDQQIKIFILVAAVALIVQRFWMR